MTVFPTVLASHAKQELIFYHCLCFATKSSEVPISVAGALTADWCVGVASPGVVDERYLGSSRGITDQETDGIEIGRAYNFRISRQAVGVLLLGKAGGAFPSLMHPL